MIADPIATEACIRQMDQAVSEVFINMLQRNCPAIDEPARIRTDFSAAICISGPPHAQCVVEFPSASARSLTTALLGTTTTSIEDTLILDAVGEVCNMIAGGWKRRLGPHSANLDLSLPSTHAGSAHPDPSRGQPPQHEVRRTYAFDNSPFVVSVAQF